MLVLVTTITFLRLSELFEKETEDFHKQDPDPFDDRHPGNSTAVAVINRLNSLNQMIYFKIE